MNSIQNRCLATSVVAHASVVGVLLLSSYLVGRQPAETPALPPIELVSLEGVKITDGQGAGGGTPTPPAQSRRQTPPATPSQLRTAQPEVRVTSTPTKPADRPLKADKPEKPDKADKPEKAEAGIKVSSNVIKAQDVDKTVKGGADSARSTGKRPVNVATAPKGPTAEEIEAANEAADRAAREAHDRAVKAAADQWKTTVGGLRTKLEAGLSGQTEISVPGPGGGGEVWIGYGTYLKSFYEARWRRPSSLPVPVAYVGVAITVARDGRLVRFELLEKSGIKVLDDSVLEVIQRYRTLERLPAGSTDPERTFRIKFRLEGTQ
jgi:TonB family protein